MVNLLCNTLFLSVNLYISVYNYIAKRVKPNSKSTQGGIVKAVFKWVKELLEAFAALLAIIQILRGWL